MAPELLFEITNDPDGMKDPYGIAINSAGRIYVTDAGNSRVLVFDGEGKLLSKWDAQGSGEGQFHSMGFGGLAIDPDDNVFVVDNGNHRVQKFDKDGNFLLQWGSEGTGDGQFVRAIGIATDKDGNALRDSHGHWVVQHDLFNHDGLTGDGVAEAFADFAVEENLSFFV